MIHDRAYIREHLSQEELLCQLAEESSELAQAALKLRRAYDGTNPTPVTAKKAMEGLVEETADVMLVLDMLDIDRYYQDCAKIQIAKTHRWADRLRNAEKKEE